MPNVVAIVELSKNMYFQTIGIFRLISLKVGFDKKRNSIFTDPELNTFCQYTNTK